MLKWKYVAAKSVDGDTPYTSPCASPLTRLTQFPGEASHYLIAILLFVGMGQSRPQDSLNISCLLHDEFSTSYMMALYEIDIKDMRNGAAIILLYILFTARRTQLLPNKNYYYASQHDQRRLSN